MQFSYNEHVFATINLISTRLHSAVSNVSDCRTSGHKFESKLSHITFVKIDREMISVVILLSAVNCW